MTDLYLPGAGIVAIPSGHAGNPCGDIRPFSLDDSRIEGSASTRSFIAFPDDPQAGTLLAPQHPITYERMKAYEFDNNATLREPWN